MLKSVLMSIEIQMCPHSTSVYVFVWPPFPFKPALTALWRLSNISRIYLLHWCDHTHLILHTSYSCVSFLLACISKTINATLGVTSKCIYLHTTIPVKWGEFLKPHFFPYSLMLPRQFIFFFVDVCYDFSFWYLLYFQ